MNETCGKGDSLFVNMAKQCYGDVDGSPYFCHMLKIYGVCYFVSLRLVSWPSITVLFFSTRPTRPLLSLLVEIGSLVEVTVDFSHV